MKARTKFLVLLFADIVSIPLALFLSFFVRFGVVEGIQQALEFWFVFPLFIAIRVLAFKIAGLYGLIWRYASVKELVSIVKTVTITSSIIILVFFVFKNYHFPTSVIIIDYLLNIAFIGGTRLSYRMYRELRVKPGNGTKRQRILIVGAGDAGAHLARQMHKIPHYQLVGFVDDDVNKIGHKVYQLGVLGTTNDIPDIVADEDVDEIVICIPSASAQEMRRIVGLCETSKVSYKTIPGINEIIDGTVNISQIREVRIEDLLRRDPVELDLRKISEYLSGERVLVSGAGGSIGSELCRQVAQFNPSRLILLGHGENSIYLIDQELRKKFPYTNLANVIVDIRNTDKIDKVFETFKPTVIFHAAAHKHVPLMEDNPDEAVMNNVLGTMNLVRSADKHKVKKFVMISTDKAVNPTNVMGATKRAAEMCVLARAAKSTTKFAVVRFGNVLGSRGSVVPLFKKQILAGGPITVTHPEVTRYFMTIKEAVQLVIQSGSMAEGGEKFILDMGEPVRIVDLARDLIRLSGLEEGIDINVEYTGLRPGEKLYEELFNGHEKVGTTANRKIFIAEPEKVDEKKLEKHVQDLITLCAELDTGRIKEKLAGIVENYSFK